MRSRSWVELGALSCALALFGACNKSGTTNKGGAGTGSIAGTTGGGTSGTGPVAGMGSTAGTGSTAGMGSTAGAGSAAGKGGSSGTGSSGTGSTAGAGGSAGTGTSGTSGGGSGGSSSTGGGSPTCDGSGAAKTGTCEANANGVYAMKVTVDTYWEQIGGFGGLILLVDAGRGNVVIYLKGEMTGVCKDGTGGMGVVHACGAEIAPFINSTVTMEAYQPIFPDSIWDSPKMPSFMTTGMTTGFNPGDTITLAAAAGLVGIDLMDPKGTFPTADMTATFTCSGGMKGDACFPDHDNDGKPGITVTMKTGGTLSGTSFMYAGAPTGIDALGPGQGVRATSLRLGLRNIIGGAGKIGDDCKSGVGDAVATAIDVRAQGCVTDSGECTPDQATFLDSNLPVYKILAKDGTPPSSAGVSDMHPSKGPQAQIVRLGDPGATFSCADVRGAMFPALP